MPFYYSITIIQFLLLLLFLPCSTLTIKQLPKHNVEDITVDEFDAVYNDKLPLIIQKTTACPANLDFNNIHQYCKGQIPQNFVHTKYESVDNGESNITAHWAGLVAGEKDQRVNFETFVQTMGTSDDNTLRFMFDLPMAEICPTLPRQVRIPPHFVNIFASHFLWRHLDDIKSRSTEAEIMSHNSNNTGWERYCPRLPFFNMYLAEGGFQTDLHIDAMHSAFVASMCVGRKLWRVMTSSDFERVYEHIGKDGLKLNGKDGSTWVMSSVISPFETWSTDNSLLQTLDVTIYEGILEPGEILYIPRGFPHAATTLDQSLMVASNDLTMQSVEELNQFCRLWKKEHHGNDDDQTDNVFSASCKEARRQYPLIQQNYHRYSSAVRRDEETTLAKATVCESTFDMLEMYETPFPDGILFVTPDNFRQLLLSGPLIVMKSQNAAGICLYLLKNWSKWTQGFDPPVRFGIIHCISTFQCLPGEDELYKQLLERIETEPVASFLYIEYQLAQSAALFYNYYGFLALDDLRIWASVQTKSKLLWNNNTSAQRRILLTLFHTGMKYVDFLLGMFGPAIFGVLIGCVVACIVCISHFHSYLSGPRRVGRSRSRNGKVKNV